MIKVLVSVFALACAFLLGFAVRHFDLPPAGTLRELHHAVMARLQERLRDPVCKAGAQTADRSAAASIVMLGDSITQGGAWAELFPNASIINCGISGDMTAGAARRLDGIVQARPRKIFVMIGINDLGSGADPEQVLANYAQIVATLRRSGAGIVVQSTLHVYGPEADRINPKVAQLNAGLAAMCARGDCAFVDLNASMSPQGRLQDALSPDGVHLNRAGYARWRDAIERYVRD